MKKIAAMLLSLILLLGCAAGTAEGAVEKIVFGTLHANGEFTLKGVLPEGYRIYPFEQDDSALISFIRAEDPARPEMILSIACCGQGLRKWQVRLSATVPVVGLALNAALLLACVAFLVYGSYNPFLYFRF